MKENEKSVYIKRTQKDYSLSLKLQIVTEIEQGRLSATQAQKNYGIQGKSTVLNWLRKYGNFDWENQTSIKMKKTPEQKLMELEQEVRLLKNKLNEKCLQGVLF